MAFILADRVFETTTTTGTGTVNLDGPVTGAQGFVAGVGDANNTFYVIEDGTDWEIGVGTVTSGVPDTLSRDTILASSNSGAAVNWGAGTRNVFVSMPAGKQPLLDRANTFTGNNTFTGTNTFNGVTLPSGDGTSGQFLKTDGAGITSFSSVSGTLIDVQVFTASGTWTKPANTRAVEIWVLGAGGGGGGADDTGNNPTSGGGGAGGTCAYSYIDTGLGATETITIGAGGAGGSDPGGGDGGDGGTSSFGAHASANGGGGGVGTGNTSSSGNAYPGGTANATATGDLIIVGGDGHNGGVSYYNALFESACGGNGGDSTHGKGGRGGVVGNVVTDVTPLDANGYGAGGGGGACGATDGEQPGGAGSDGLVIVKSYK